MSSERSIAERFGLPVHEEIESFSFVRDKIAIIPYLFAKQKRVLPLSKREGSYRRRRRSFGFGLP